MRPSGCWCPFRLAQFPAGGNAWCATTTACRSGSSRYRCSGDAMGHAHETSFDGTDDVLVREVLAEYGELTRRHLDTYLQAEEPDSYLYDLLADYPRRKGKMLRSSLCIAMARATGARIEDAMGCAVAIELMHNAMLVHDDIEDDSDERRGA